MNEPRAARLKIGIIGLGGSATRLHIPALQQLPDVAVVAGAEINPTQAERTQRRFGIPRVYADYAIMLVEEELDGVYVCLPNRLHIPAVEAALRHRVHVLCEKPLGLSAVEAQRAARLAEANGRWLMPGYNLRFLPTYTRARALVRSQRLGHILQIQATLAKPGPYTGWDPKSDWYYDPENCGVLFDLGSHAIDLIRYVCGVELQDFSTRAVTTLPGLEVSDSLAIAFTTDSCAAGTLNLTWGAPANVDLLAIHGTAGSLLVSWNYFEHLTPGSSGISKLATYATHTAAIAGRVVRSLLRRPAPTDTYLALAREFSACLTSSATPRIQAEDGVRVLQGLEAIATGLGTPRRRVLSL